MSLLTHSLLDSKLLGPLVRLATLPADRLNGYIGTSETGKIADRIGATVLSPFSRLASRDTFRQLLLGPVLTLGIAGLFWLLTWQSTGIIGVATGALLAFVLLLGVVFGFRIRQHLTSLDLLVGAFLASAVLSTAFSSYVTTSLIGLAKWMTFVAGYTVFRVVSQSGRSWVLALLGVLVALGLGESLIGFYQAANHIQPLATWSDPSTNPELMMDRIFGTLQPNNPNLLAGFLIPCFAAALGLSAWLLTRPTWRGRLASVPMVAISLIILVAITMTGSRGGYLAIAAMLLTVFAVAGHLIWHATELRAKRWPKILWGLLLAGSILLASGGILASPKLQHRVASIFAMREDSSISYRLNVYQSVTRMVQDNPVVGIGPGNDTFKKVYGLYMIPGYSALSAYNVPLEIAAEQGLIGLGIFLLLLLTIKIRAALALDSQARLEDKIIVALLFTGIVGSFVYGFFDTIWYRPSVNLLFWFFVAVLAWETEKIIGRDTDEASR